MGSKAKSTATGAPSASTTSTAPVTAKQSADVQREREKRRKTTEVVAPKDFQTVSAQRIVAL